MTVEKTCPDCGATRRSGSFCDVCGAVLDWGDRTQKPKPAAKADDEAPPPEPAEPPAAEKPVKEPDDEPETVVAAPDPEPVKASPVDSDASERARNLLVPVTEVVPPTQPGPQVTPVLPGRPEAARPQVRVAEEEAVVGGVICPWCDTANPRDRHFCRKCAMSLTSTDPAGSRARPWWRRILEPDRSETPWAGERPRLRRSVNRMIAMVVALILGLVVVGYGVAYADDAANAVVDHFSKRAPVSVGSSKASHSDPAHGPQQAFDGLNTTFWGTGYGGNGAGQYLEASFGQPRDLLNVIVTPGVSKQPDLFAKQARPQIIDALITSSDGKTITRTLRLDDAPGPQKLRFRARNAVTVRLTLQAAYGAGPNVQVCITEIEFFGRSLVGRQ